MIELEYRPSASAQEFLVRLHEFIEQNQPPDMTSISRWEQVEESHTPPDDEFDDEANLHVAQLNGTLSIKQTSLLHNIYI